MRPSRVLCSHSPAGHIAYYFWVQDRRSILFCTFVRTQASLKEEGRTALYMSSSNSKAFKSNSSSGALTASLSFWGKSRASGVPSAMWGFSPSVNNREYAGIYLRGEKHRIMPSALDNLAFALKANISNSLFRLGWGPPLLGPC